MVKTDNVTLKLFLHALYAFFPGLGVGVTTGLYFLTFYDSFVLIVQLKLGKVGISSLLSSLGKLLFA